MEFFSSDEEEPELIEFWNNWRPPPTDPEGNSVHYSCEIVSKKADVVFNFSKTSDIENIRFGNWIPPADFLNNPLKSGRVTAGKNIKLFQSVENVQSEREEVRKETQGFFGTKSSCEYITAWKKEMNIDWGNRVQLHDVTKLTDGDLIWGVVNLGIFSTIKIWVNDYKNLCCSANGEISKLGSSELTFISITNIEILRKMLNVSLSQWAVLCEVVQKTKTVLKFDAFQDYKLNKIAPLERMWFFVCKRRHFLPRQFMLLKFCGAVKCMKKFHIAPKLLVEDIRGILENSA